MTLISSILFSNRAPPLLVPVPNMILSSDSPTPIFSKLIFESCETFIYLRLVVVGARFFRPSSLMGESIIESYFSPKWGRESELCLESASSILKLLTIAFALFLVKLKF